jgi:hypothetical protein
MIYKNLIYIHIPKTGGSSIRNSLNLNYELLFNSNKENLIKMGYSNLTRLFENYDFTIGSFEDHLPYQLIKNKELNLNKFIFTFLRNPFSRAVSLYFEITNGPTHCFNNKKRISFDDFIKVLIEKDYWFSIPMIDYIGEKNLSDLNFIGRFENFENDIYKLKNKIKIKIKHHNYNNHMNSNKKFNDYRSFFKKSNTIDNVTKYYHRDLKFFGYSYDNFLSYEEKKTKKTFILSRMIKRKLFNLI